MKQLTITIKNIHRISGKLQLKNTTKVKITIKNCENEVIKK